MIMNGTLLTTYALVVRRAGQNNIRLQKVQTGIRIQLMARPLNDLTEFGVLVPCGDNDVGPLSLEGDWLLLDLHHVSDFVLVLHGVTEGIIVAWQSKQCINHGIETMTGDTIGVGGDGAEDIGE